MKFTMGNKLVIFTLFILCYVYVNAENIATLNETEAVSMIMNEMSLEMISERLLNQTMRAEKGLKTFIKGAVKNLLPTLMNYNKESLMSGKCMGAFMKYIAGLTTVKYWALKMLDSTSKPPSGILEGTMSEFGAFDQCLSIELPTRKGEVEFRGQYCAIEVKPWLPPPPRNFSLAKLEHAGPLDSIGKEFVIGGNSFHYLKFRLGVCVPSLCTLKDMQGIAKQIAERIEMDFRIPQCYVKESVVFRPVHIAVICVVSLLLIACIAGCVVEYKSMNAPTSDSKLSTGQQILLCFSPISNYRRLISASKGSEDLKALHGLRAVSMAWVILGHSYVWTNFQLLRAPSTLITWFNMIDFGAILNGWLAVETFFFLSGLLTCYSVLKIMPKTKGRINVPIYILRRYIRLTPSLLLVMGLLFFLPLISSGPFWYERVDPEIRSCTKYWWRSILYISNWMGMKNICVHPTWYLSADFQLHVISVIVLFVLYRYPKFGLSLIAVLVIACSVAVGALTYVWDLPPLILISSGNEKRIEKTVDIVHMSTFAHAGPYYAGIVMGYLIIKYKDIKMGKKILIIGWLLSALLSLASLYGAHRWNIGESHGPVLTAIYAALHRTTFTIGVAWVVFVCVTGHAGLVNSFLSSSMFAPFSRLTYLIYLMHSLVIWTRMGSLRERNYFSHYNKLYDYTANVVVSILFTVPLYLLLEAPLSNLDRLVFSRKKTSDSNSINLRPQGNIQRNLTQSLKQVGRTETDHTIVPVELMSVKHLENGCNNLAFNNELLRAKDR